MKCEKCGKKFEELVTRQGFCMTYFVEWVCYKCYKELQGEEFGVVGERVELEERKDDER